MPAQQTMLAVGYGSKRALLKLDLDSGLWIPFDPAPPWGSGGGGCQGIATAPTGEIYIADSSRNRFYHYDPIAESWSIVTWSDQGSNLILYSIDCVDNTFAVAGVVDKIYFWQPALSDQWERVLDGASPNYDCWAYSPTEVWACNYSQCWHWDGLVWTNVYSLLQAAGGSGHPYAVWGLSPTEVYVGMQNDRLYRWNGSAFSEHGDMEGNVRSIWGTASDNIYVVDNQYERVRRYTGSWAYKFTASAGRPSSIRGLSPTRVFCVNYDYLSARGGIYETQDGFDTWDFWQWGDSYVANAGLYDLASWQVPDEIPPTITPIDPISGSTDAPKNSSIAFDVTDDAGVNPNTIKAWVRGELVLQNQIAVNANWSVLIEIITDGYRVTLTPGRLAYYRNLEIVNVKAYAADLSTNETTAAWYFTTTRSSVLGTYPMLIEGVRRLDEE
jgi:hypothetical protein